MIHRRKGRKLKRTASHRKATLSALSTALLQHKKIQTTVAKAKELRPLVEKIITRAKNAVANESEGKLNVHARREVYRFIRNREIIQLLFSEIAEKVANRPGGYTRIVKLGQRLGDGAHMAMIELVDYNIAQEQPKPTKQKQDRRRRISNQKTSAKKTEVEKTKEETSAPQTA